MSEWTIRQEAPGMVLVEWRRHLLGYWHGASSPAAARSVLENVQALAPTHPSGQCVYIATMLDGFSLPDSVTRSAMVKIGPLLEGKLYGFGLVIGGTGFRSAALRAFVTGVAQLVGPKYPVPTFETMALAEQWFRPRVLEAKDEWGDELVAVDQEVRGRLKV